MMISDPNNNSTLSVVLERLQCPLSRSAESCTLTHLLLAPQLGHLFALVLKAAPHRVHLLLQPLLLEEDVVVAGPHRLRLAVIILHVFHRLIQFFLGVAVLP